MYRTDTHVYRCIMMYMYNMYNNMKTRILSKKQWTR